MMEEDNDSNRIIVSEVTIIGAKIIKELNFCVDAAFAAHGNMRSYTGRVMSFGNDIMCCEPSEKY